ncbi:MAG: CapA family protein [Alicyclobacillaceae bacterium]|nr:CapA family protein [Alicyclobacillaceae bacterium]
MRDMTIAAVGDILLWRGQIRAARKPGGEGYHFSPVFAPVAPVLRAADLTLGNLETTFSGPRLPFQRRNPRNGFPMFNCPDSLAEALRASGFDILTTANNHCLDGGMAGLRRTLDVLDQAGLSHTGTFRSQAEARRLLIRDVKGLQVGVLAYTYGTNGLTAGPGCAWAVNRIREAKILQDIRRMRRFADLVVVCLHFGREFHLQPSAGQRALVMRLFRHGADVILGAHPHVIQPAESLLVRELDGRLRRKFVIYSLGNFVSARMRGMVRTESGVITLLTVEPGGDGRARVTGVRHVPTWVQRRAAGGRAVYRVLPVREWLKRPGDGVTTTDLATMRRVLQATTAQLHGRAPRPQ